MAGRFKLEHPWKENIQKINANNLSPNFCGRDFTILQRSADSTGMITVVVSISYLLAPPETYLHKVQRSYSNNEKIVFEGTISLCFSRELWQQAAGKASMPDLKRYRGTCVHRKVAD